MCQIEGFQTEPSTSTTLQGPYAGVMITLLAGAICYLESRATWFCTPQETCLMVDSFEPGFSPKLGSIEVGQKLSGHVVGVFFGDPVAGVGDDGWSEVFGDGVVEFGDGVGEAMLAAAG